MAPAPGRAGDYGVDAPYVPLGLGAAGVLFLVIGFVSTSAPVWHTIALLFFLQAGIYLHTTRRGKFVAWDRLLDSLALCGDEQVVDLGCGRGAVLVAAAKRLPTGTAHGVDLWRSKDQTGNAEEATRRNAELERVSDRVELHTGDLVDLPFDDASFDVVLSSLAIHNIPSAAGRTEAIDQAVRVLRPGGRLVIVDIKHTKDHEARLVERGLADVTRRSLGPSVWFGGPWVAGTAVTATKPA
jgi:arsenite methyltransferase